jgi:hypothetical protein
MNGQVRVEPHSIVIVRTLETKDLGFPNFVVLGTIE